VRPPWFILLGVSCGNQSLARIKNTKETPSRLIVAIDQSGSMDLRDRSARQGKNYGLARALTLPDFDLLPR